MSKYTRTEKSNDIVLSKFLFSKQGSVTIESALVLPVVIIVFAVLLYLSNVLYVENTIHSKMLLIADDLSLSACVLDKTILLDGVQKKYQEGDQVVGEIKDAVNTITGKNFVSDEGIKGLMNSFNDSYRRIGDLSLNSSAIEVLEVASDLISNFKNMREDVKEGALKSLPDFTLLIHWKKNLTKAGQAVGVNLLSQFLTEVGVKYEFNKIFSDDELKNMRVSNLKIQDGAFLIPDDSISFSYSYDIFFPFLSDFLGEEYKVKRWVTTRAFTGSYDAKDVKKKKLKASNKYVYIATTSRFNKSYHYISCLRKPLQSAYLIDVGSRSVCKYCKEHCVRGLRVYYVSNSSKVHYDDKCPRIYSKKIRRLTVKEAEELGYKACRKKGCIGYEESK